MDRSVISRFANREHWTVDDIRHHIERSKIVLFGRGDTNHPRCGYTKDALNALQISGCDYELVDVAGDPSAGAALRAFAGPVPIPAMYVDGELVGSSDSLYSFIQSGELVRKLS